MSYKLNYSLLVLVVLWQLLLWLHCPLSGVDGPASWSHAYSILNGNLFFDSYFNSSPRFLTGILILPFVAVFKSFYAPFFVLLVFQLFSLFLAYKLAKSINKTSFFYYFSLLFLLSPLMWTQRQEIIAIPFLIGVCIFAFKPKSNKNYLFILFLLLIASAIHPLAGLVGCFLLIGIYKPIIKRKHIIGVIILVSIFLFFVKDSSITSYYWNHFVHRFLNYNYNYPIRGVLYSLPLFLIFAYKLPKYHQIVLVIFILILLLLAMTYYWVYLFLFLIFIKERTILSIKKASLAAVYLSLFSLINPTIQHIENAHYGRKVCDILQTLESVKIDEHRQIFIPSSISIPMIYSKSTKLLVNNGGEAGFHGIVNKNDILYVYRESSLYLIEKKFKEKEKMNLVKKTKGLVTMTSFYKKRTSPIGLWEIK